MPTIKILLISDQPNIAADISILVHAMWLSKKLYTMNLKNEVVPKAVSFIKKIPHSGSGKRFQSASSCIGAKI